MLRNRQNWCKPLPTTVRSIRPNDTVPKTVRRYFRNRRLTWRETTVPWVCYKSTDLRTRWWFRTSIHFSKTKNYKDTNFAIGGFLAGLHRSPLILFFFFQDLLANFDYVEDSSAHWSSKHYQIEIELQIFYTTIRDFTNWVNWNPQIYIYIYILSWYSYMYIFVIETTSLSYSPSFIYFMKTNMKIVVSLDLEFYCYTYKIITSIIFIILIRDFFFFFWEGRQLNIIRQKEQSRGGEEHPPSK